MTLADYQGDCMKKLRDIAAKKVSGNKPRDNVKNLVSITPDGERLLSDMNHENAHRFQSHGDPSGGIGFLAKRVERMSAGGERSVTAAANQ